MPDDPLPRAATAALDLLFSGSEQAFFAFNHEGVCVVAVGGPLGVTAGRDAVGQELRAVFAERPKLLRAVRDAIGGSASHAVLRWDDRIFRAECRPVQGHREVAASITVTEITEQSRRERRLQDALNAERARARSDALTGTLNHAAIVDALRECVAAHERSDHTIAMVDVDGLKAVNDTWGHQAGDLVLARVADALQRSGAVVGRYGGDEFVALLCQRGLQAGDEYRRDVLAALDRMPVLDPASGAPLPVSITVGLAVYPEEATGAEDLIRLADSAMYAARRLRRGDRSRRGMERLDSERAARLVGEIVPLLTATGTREEKLGLVAHQLAAGGGYDAVNFEVSGDGVPGAWETTLVRDGDADIDAWVREQEATTDHPLGRLMEQKRAPVFIDSLEATDLMTERERELVLAAGFRSTLVVPMIWHDRLVGMLSVGSKHEAAFTPWDAQFLTAVSSQVTAIVFMTTLVDDLKAAADRLQRAHAETVLMLAGAAEAHDQTTGRHLQRVRALAVALASELGYDPRSAADIGIAAVLHDIGKIRVPDAILASPSTLAPDERTLMQQHTVWGGDFLAGREGFDLASVVARCHHERWDGAGYPSGLRGPSIPEAAAITAVADSLDAMTSDRPYRIGRPLGQAIQEVMRCSGTQFSPRIVAALVRLYRRGALQMDGEQRQGRAA